MSNMKKHAEDTKETSADLRFVINTVYLCWIGSVICCCFFFSCFLFKMLSSLTSLSFYCSKKFAAPGSFEEAGEESEVVLTGQQVMEVRLLKVTWLSS